MHLPIFLENASQNDNNIAILKFIFQHVELTHDINPPLKKSSISFIVIKILFYSEIDEFSFFCCC